MAYLEDIPKYAFGTTHEVDLIRRDASGGSMGEVDWSIGTGSSGLEGCLLNTTGNTSRASNSNNNNSNSNSKDLADSKQAVKRISENKFRALVLHAVQLGCRHFDCAPLYRNQAVVGRALREAMNSVPRQKFFLTSKLPPNMMRPENITRSISKSIEELQCNYLDLFLIHAPFATKHIRDDQFYPLDEEGNLLLDEEEHLLENAWRTLVELKRRGFTRYIGLSNVNLEQLIRLNQIHHIDVVQNEYHIYNQNREIFDYCEEIDVHFEAYAAMGNPEKARRDKKPCVFLDPVVQRVARDNRLSLAEVNIQWVYQQPLSYVIRCDTARQLEENLRATKCISLPVNDLIDLDSLNRDVRLYLFDEHKGITKHREYPFKKPTKECKEPLGECFHQQRSHHQRARQQRTSKSGHSNSNQHHNNSSSSSNSGSSSNNINSNYNHQIYNYNNNNNNNNIESDLSSSDCSDMSGEKISLVSNLKTSSSQSDSSITTTIARCSTPLSITDITDEITATTTSASDGVERTPDASEWQQQQA